jgi:hypothetical protein
MILFVLARRRSNAWGAFGVGLGATVVVFMLMAPTLEAMWGDSDTGLVAGLVVTLGAGVLAAVVIMKVAFPLKPAGKAPVRSEAPRSAKPRPARSSSQPPGPPPDVFISYKRDERAEVLAIAKRLEALKLRVWFDAEMKSGTTFDAEIDRQIRAAKAVLVCWSPGAVASDWVRGEATIGRQRGVLAAAMLKPCDLPAPFNLVHADNLTGGIGPRNPEWLRSVERIGMLAGRPGLAAYEALELTRDKQAYAAWIAQNSGDALLGQAVERLKQL